MKQKVNTQILIKNYGIILILILSFWAVKPLFAPGFFPMHDDTQVARVYEMGKALKDGMFPVRWVPDLGYGYGYPIFNFYAPLAYYFGGFLTIVGFDALIATKIMMIVGILLSGVFMYLLAKEFWGELGGVVSALFYVYAPYHAVDIYVRGDVAEFWAYAFIPLMFYGVYKVYKNYKKWIWVIVGSLGYAAVILSHNLTAMVVTPFLTIAILLYCFIAYRNKKLFTIYYLLFTIFLGLAIAAFYWLPALFEMKYTNVLSQIGGGADFRDHFVCIQQLWNSQWGFGGSIHGCIDGLSLKIGKLHILAVFIALFIAITTGKFFYIFRHSGERSDSRIPTDLRDSGQAKMTVFILLSILGFAISVFMVLDISKTVWEQIPIMAFFQYPWRFLLLASFFASLASGAVIWFLVCSSTSKESRSLPRHLRGDSSTYFNTIPYLSAAFLIFLLLFFNLKFFVPQTIFPATAKDFTNEIALKWTASKTSDEYLPPNFKKPKSVNEIAKIPAIRPQETSLQKVSNLISLISSLALIVGIILFKSKAKI